MRQKSLILSCMKSKTCRWKNVTSRRANLQVHRHGTKGQGCIMLHCDEFHKLRNAMLIPCILDSHPFEGFTNALMLSTVMDPRKNALVKAEDQRAVKNVVLREGWRG